ncbi:MAG: Coenzyme F420 hydrogenase/dehydrogenase, beta subunit C-terminal domain [Proteobacteria bacterium]|nr:Coenzyme F420 hydrogenase/dehydrogenase, beta subunit C-terminal domain [Pseudomonadota bacterium]
MTKIQNLETIVSSGLCSGCGLCESIAGRDSVEMRVTSAGYIRPLLKRELPTDVLQSVLAVCPGVSVTGPALDEQTHTVWGPIQEVYRSWAANPAIRYKAAAGGSLTALGCYLLDAKRVDAIVHVKASTTQPMLTTAHVSRTSDEVIAGSQSRYGPAAPLVSIHELLRAGQKIAVVAKPCDVAAVRSLMKVDPVASQQILYCLSIFCGGTPSLYTAETIAKFLGMEPNKVSRFKWRGEGWPGRIRIEGQHDVVREMTYEQAWHTSGVPWSYGSSLQFRCKICPDAEGELADIACPDGWVVKDRKRIYDDAPGVNLAVVRTRKGGELLREAVAAGYLELASFDMDEIEDMHGDHVRRKLGQPARNLGLRLMGQPYLRVTHYRSFAKVLAAGIKANLEALVGTIQRVRINAQREPLN